jgi:hypothetical protein
VRRAAGEARADRPTSPSPTINRQVNVLSPGKPSKRHPKLTAESGHSRCLNPTVTSSWIGGFHDGPGGGLISKLRPHAMTEG